LTDIDYYFFGNREGKLLVEALFTAPLSAAKLKWSNVCLPTFIKVSHSAMRKAGVRGELSLLSFTT
jgi:hypothetical protein